MLGTVPEPLRSQVTRWWDRACGLPALMAAYRTLPDPLRDEVPHTIAASEFIASALLQDPEALGWLERNDDPSMASAAGLEYERRVAAAAGTADAQRILREWRRREMVRIAWRDIAGRAGVTETLLAVSDLADACIRAGVAAAQRHLESPFGRPRTGAIAGGAAVVVDAGAAEVPFIVVAMGKLGGRELNFSSDVDLVFLYAEAGETDGARPIDNAEYFNRLGRELIRLLDARTEDGFVFRVDTRLRPFGDSGALAVSLPSLENYLQEHGRDWERYAWIKARAVVGADAYAGATRDFVRPFVYRRYLDFGVFDSLRDMKALIAREVARHDLGQDLKLGAGGIRELEFIVQSMQLVRGGSDRRLQNAGLLEVLPLLAGAKLLSKPAVAELHDAYLVLRKAENAVQMIRDEQIHSIPEDPCDRARLSLNMGLAGWPATAARIEAARRCVALQFEALVFGAPETQRRNGEGTLDWLASDDVKIDEELRAARFPVEEVAPVAALLDEYRHTVAYRRLDEAARRRVHVILARLLKAAAIRAAPATVVHRVLRVLEAIGARSSYLALLKEQPPALERLIDVCAISGFLARQVADFPLLLDELIDPNAFDEPPSRASFIRELEARTERLPTDDPERQVEALRQFQKAAVFGVAFADLTGRMPLMKVSDRLTDIAELIVERCMRLAWDQMTQAYGIPHCGDCDQELRQVKVAVAGYGKLGGLELGYGSDLDLVFLHDSSGEIQQTKGERPIDNTVFFLRLGQRIVHLLTMHSAAGRLYEVDMRLRPNGKGGFLMTGIEAFERYQRMEAWTWEHQALLRARAVGGDPALCRAFEDARRRVLSTAVHRDTLRTDVAEMRVRMRRELSRAEAGQFDIKQDAGGIADIEFLVQYRVLASAGEHPELLTYSDNIRQLEGLSAAGVLEAETAQWLKDSYIAYRTVLHHLSLEGGERVVEAAPHAEMRARIIDIWRSTFEPNALLASWTGPFGGLPPFDRVRVVDFKPALETAMAEKLREIDEITANRAVPTFDNTLVELERAGRTFNRVNAIYDIWASSMNTGEFQAVEREMGPQIAAFYDAISQNTALFARIEAVYRQSLEGQDLLAQDLQGQDLQGQDEATAAQFTAEDRRLCWHHYTSFVRAGAKLDESRKTRVRAINERLASLYANFSQNLLADEANYALYLTDDADLAGLPEAQRSAAASAAAAANRPGQWAILNTRSAVDPFLTYAERRDLRETVWRTFYNRGNNGGAHDNNRIITEILGLRRERAQLLGYPTHAHWRLEDSMAGDPDEAMALLMRIWPAAVARAREEVADMQAIADAATPGLRIAAWDYRYYAEKVRRAKFDLDMNEVKPYLQLEKLREGMFWAAGRLYGFAFSQVTGVSVHDPDVRVWEVKSEAGRHVGLWYFDPYARAGKNSGAWMSEYREQSKLDVPVSPIVSNNTNFLKNEGGAPILISWDDAVTLFHEFGHALHGLNSDVRFPSLSGTRVVRDFVELPSQLNENWLSVPEILSRFALHHESGEPMPAAMAAKIKATQTFNQGFATVEYLAAALVDLKLHLAAGPVADPEAFEKATLSALGMPDEIVMRHRMPQFAHIFAGDAYSAGYYSYLWAEVLDRDAFEAFVEAGDPFDKTVAKRLHDDIMCVGNSVDPGEAYRHFRGREPKIDALLRARGFAAQS
ncbi:MAG TPA: bifunctional [glutamate--ammonia ligase]-adenylyl-L-tyrosine phosphorylase/[glutamate--ammonia-ligase] adenylyltransferase [Steroidobacteraceae bacterium]|nr:bifunctional [glutamate--ammonia ligase]-adenylyl-L-tyrosine phosphorylase/[glutamate--ammonia-ligase] adenylyltransferase [Steroidobacteraceae bacterium]